MEKKIPTFSFNDALTILSWRTERRSSAEGHELELLQAFFHRIEEAKLLARELLTETKEKGVTCGLRAYLKDEDYWSRYKKMQEGALESIILALEPKEE